ncbi:hypothetical protein ACVWZK_008641 [Bradyrhizobium sp. GM0.4]
MQPVDLDHQKVERGQIGSHEVGQPRRQRDEPPRGRRLRNPRSGRCRHVTLGQPDSAAEPARRHIDQHQVHRPATEPVLLRRRFPARDRHLAAVHIPDPRALASILPPWKRSVPAFGPNGSPAAPRRDRGAARGRRDIRLHHRAERLVPAARQDWSKLARTSANASSTSLGRRRTSRCDISPSWRCSRLWNQHPEPTGSRWATPTSSENQQNTGQPPVEQYMNSQESTRALCAMPRKWGRTSLAKISISGPMAWSSA